MAAAHMGSTLDALSLLSDILDSFFLTLCTLTVGQIAEQAAIVVTNRQDAKARLTIRTLSFGKLVMGWNEVPKLHARSINKLNCILDTVRYKVYCISYYD